MDASHDISSSILQALKKPATVLIAGFTLIYWFRRDESSNGPREVLTTSEREHLKILRRAVKELRRANDILKTASAFFAQPELDRRLKS